MRRPGLLLALLTPMIVLAAIVDSTAAAAWKPEAPVYGIGEHANVGVAMSDGTVLRANVFYPTDPHSGGAAAGPFPVIMVQDPYGKDTTGSASGKQGGPEAGSETGPPGRSAPGQRPGYSHVAVHTRAPRVLCDPRDAPSQPQPNLSRRARMPRTRPGSACRCRR